MKPRYVVINEFERDEFEKEWQLSYGYGRGITLPTFNPERACEQLRILVNSYSANSEQLIVEKISDEGRELYYRI